jgi:hypothetical protein
LGGSVISAYCSGLIVEMIWRISPTRWRVMSSTIASMRCCSPVWSCSSTNPNTRRSSTSSRRRRLTPRGSTGVAA